MAYKAGVRKTDVAFAAVLGNYGLHMLEKECVSCFVFNEVEYSPIKAYYYELTAVGPHIAMTFEFD